MKIAFCCAEDINLGAGYVMAYLRKRGHNVRLFFDPLQFKRGYARNKILASMFSGTNAIIKDVQRYKPDIVCISCITATYQWGLYLAEKIKQKVNCKICFGGIHATLVPEEVKRHKFIDEVVVGCGIKHFGGHFDPDEIYPDRESFLKQLPPEHRKNQLFMTSFGCPFNCSFCGNEQLRKVYQHRKLRRNVNDCIDELQQLKANGAEQILFVDDIFTSDKKWLGWFLLEYASKIGLPFVCFGHVRFLDEEIIESLKTAGCHTIWIGIQSGDERLRREILNRPEKNQEIIDVCKLIKKHGLKLMVDHIFGIPTENAMSQDISYNLYEEIKPNIINCYELLYFPKAKIIEHALRTGDLMPDDVEKINRGEGLNYQLNQKTSAQYRQYAKSFIAMPLPYLTAETWSLLPTWLLKLMVHLRAGRGFMLRAMIQNELYFTMRALWKKLNPF